MRHPQSHAPSHQQREQKEDIGGDLQTACYQNVSKTERLPLRSAVRCFTNLLKSGGAGSLERTRLRPISLLNRENTGNFREFGRYGGIFGRINSSNQ